MKDIINRQDVIDMLMSENQNEPHYPEWYASKVEELESVPVLYPCDQDRCGDKCHWPLCQLTTDPEHAVAGGATILIDNLDLEPKRPEGPWVITEAYPHNVYCSNCHKKFAQTQWSVWEDGSLSRNFCSNCGARMIGGEASGH